MGTLRPASAPFGKTHEGRCTTVSLSCLFLSVGSASPNHGYPCSMGETGQESVLYLEGEEMGPERPQPHSLLLPKVSLESAPQGSQPCTGSHEPVNSPPATREDSLEAIPTLHTHPQSPDLLMGLTRTGK